jgi:hypothetical protein
MSKSTEGIDHFIPDDIDVETLLSWMTSGTKIHCKLDYAQLRLKPIIGRMLLLVARRKDLLESFGCKTFSDFMNHYIPERMSMPATEAWNALFVAREFPDITCEDFETIGFKNLKVICAAVPNEAQARKSYAVEASVAKQRKRLLDVVKQNNGMTHRELAAKVEELGIASKSQVIKSQIVIRTNEALVEEWERFCKDKRVITVVGSEDPGEILFAMIGECLPAWISMGSVINE